METLNQKYNHSLLSKYVAEEDQNDGHFTVHEFNEALYSTLCEYNSFVNFKQIENATFYFFMDNLTLNDEDATQNYIDQLDELKTTIKRTEHGRSKRVYNLINRNPKTDERKMWGRHTRIRNRMRAFVDEVPSDWLLKGTIDMFIRDRDYKRLLKGGIRDVEDFRLVKLTSIEFTRYAFQILFDESIRKIKEMVLLNYTTSIRCKKPGSAPLLQAFYREDYNAYYEVMRRDLHMYDDELQDVRDEQREMRVLALEEKYEIWCAEIEEKGSCTEEDIEVLRKLIRVKPSLNKKKLHQYEDKSRQQL